MGYEPVSLADSCSQWIKKEEIKAGETVFTDFIYRGTETAEGDYGAYKCHYFENLDSELVGMAGSTSIDQQIEKGVSSGVIVAKKTKMRITYIGPIAKKGKKLNDKSFKKFAVDMDNSHWMVEEPPVVSKEAPEMDSEEEIPF